MKTTRIIIALLAVSFIAACVQKTAPVAHPTTGKTYVPHGK